MGIFSKKPTELDLALNHLNNILINHYQDWAKTLRLALGAKAASEQPIEKVELHNRRLIFPFEDINSDLYFF